MVHTEQPHVSSSKIYPVSICPLTLAQLCCDARSLCHLRTLVLKTILHWLLAVLLKWKQRLLIKKVFLDSRPGRRLIANIWIGSTGTLDSFLNVENMTINSCSKCKTTFVGAQTVFRFVLDKHHDDRRWSKGCSARSRPAYSCMETTFLSSVLSCVVVSRQILLSVYNTSYVNNRNLLSSEHFVRVVRLSAGRDQMKLWLQVLQTNLLC